MIYHLSQSNGYQLLTIIKAICKLYLERVLARNISGLGERKAVFFYKT